MAAGGVPEKADLIAHIVMITTSAANLQSLERRRCGWTAEGGCPHIPCVSLGWLQQSCVLESRLCLTPA